MNIEECCNFREICSFVTSNAELFEEDPSCNAQVDIHVLLKEAIDFVEEEQANPESEYSQAALCNVGTLLEIALVDVQGAAYAVDRALSQLGCSPGDSDLCDKLLEAKHLAMDGVEDEL